jgi:hypothetical protein
MLLQRRSRAAFLNPIGWHEKRAMVALFLPQLPAHVESTLALNALHRFWVRLR